MNNTNKENQAVDPIELLNEHYEEIEMNIDYRRELLARSCGIVTGRGRRLVFRRALGLAGVAAVVVLVVLVGYLVYLGPKAGRPAELTFSAAFFTG